jgi:hypothetical protein
MSDMYICSSQLCIVRSSSLLRISYVSYIYNLILLLMTVSNSLLIKVSNVRMKEYQEEMQGDEGLFQELKKVAVAAPESIAQSILETQWKSLFSGTAVVRVNFLDDNLVIFDLSFLGRVAGKQ